MVNVLHKNHITKELDEVIIDLLIHQPFFGRLLAEMVKVVDHECFGISISSFSQEYIQLRVNPEYWDKVLKGGDEKQTLQLRKNAFKKQLVHFIFKHDLQFFDYEDKTAFIIAAELVANQYLEEEKLQDLFSANLFNLKLTPSNKLQDYYKIILETFDDKKLNDILDLNFKHYEYIRTWEKQIPKFEKELESSFRKHFILKLVKSNSFLSDSDLPTPMIEYLNHLKNDTHSVLNWKKILRQFCKNSNRTNLIHTIGRSSKRYGTFPGIKIRKQPKLLIAIDTSGSINTTDLVHFFNEINHIWKQKAEIRIVECDTHIRQNYNYNGIAPIQVKGRGNTDFNEAIKYANEKYHPDAMIYFTDGFGPKPRIKPSKPMLWIVSTNGIKRRSKTWNELPGWKVKMNVVT